MFLIAVLLSVPFFSPVGLPSWGMDRQLRPRRQGIPSDHNYFAQYPNTIYTTPSPTIAANALDCGDPLDPPSKKRRASTTKDASTQHTSDDVAKTKKRWHYFGYRRKRRGTSLHSRVAGTVGIEGCPPPDNSGSTKIKRKRAVKRKLKALSSDASLQLHGGVNDASKDGRIPKCACCCRWRLSRKERRQSQRLVIKNFKLPFDKLPDLCKLTIFSYLTVSERGQMAQVCQEWRRLIRHPGLWSLIDFNVFNPTHCNTSSRGLSLSQYPWFMTLIDYNKYCLRMQKYVSFLEDITPHVRFLRFAYDLVNPKDEWLQQLLSFLKHSNCNKLVSVEMDWTLTPVRPPCADRYCCFFNKARIALQKHITRVLFFHQFLNKLTRAAPQVVRASLPFDWSERSVLLLCRWRHLQSLRLDSYIQLRLSLQELLAVVLNKLGQLTELQLSVCSPLVDTADVRTLFSISHPRLCSLDIRECKGVFLRTLQTPSLKVLKMPQTPWRGVGGGVASGARRRWYPPCLYPLIKQGAPQLLWFNHHRLHDYWLEYPYEELESVLNRACPCKAHSKKLLQHQAEENLL